MELHAETSEIARLEALLGPDPGSPAFSALAEANRRAGRLEEAERVAREGLRRRPDHVAGRVALALALLDQHRADEARVELERVLEDVPDHPLAAAALAERGAGARDPLDRLAEDEIEGAFAEAEAAVGEMVDANQVAAEALRAADLDEPEGLHAADLDEPGTLPPPRAGSPFATRTVAELLERQGHRDEAAALRREMEAPSPADADGVIVTLERWLDNLRRTRR